MNNFKIFTLILITLISLTSCSNDDAEAVKTDVNGTLQLNFDAKVATADFTLNTPFSVNDQSYQFDHLRYWISAVKLVNDKNETFTVADSFFLIEETSEILVQDKYKYAARKRENIDLANVPSGSYTKIIFSVGVDAVHNDNMSIQNGELSQLNGMTNVSWMWHTSYIFSSLTGKNTGSDTKIAIETGLNTNYRTIEITLPTAAVIATNKTAKINLNVAVDKIIKDIDVKANPVISAKTPELMTKVADNYKENVFTVKSVE